MKKKKTKIKKIKKRNEKKKTKKKEKKQKKTAAGLQTSSIHVFLFHLNPEKISISLEDFFTLRLLFALLLI